jgi:hypothetical protein
MKQVKRKNGGSLLFLFFVTAIFLSACNAPPSGYWEYQFVNESSYAITVTLNQEYRLETSKEGYTPPTYTTPFSVSSNSSRIVYVKDDDVDYQWTASSAGDNRYIYVVANGSKVTFKEINK